MLSSALIAITKFPVASHTYPDVLISLLPPVDESVDHMVLSTQQILLLILSVTKEKSIQQGALAGVVKYLLNEEIVNMPRGVVYSALQKLNTSETEKNLQEIKMFLRSCLTINKGPPSNIILVMHC